MALLKSGLFYSIFMKSLICYLRIYSRSSLCIYLCTIFVYVPWTEVSSAYRTTNECIADQTCSGTLRCLHMLCVKVDTRRSHPPLTAGRLAAIVCGAEGMSLTHDWQDNRVTLYQTTAHLGPPPPRSLISAVGVFLAVSACCRLSAA